MPDLLAISGSLRARSSNSALLEAAALLAPAPARLIPFRGLVDLPLFNPDLDREGAFAAVEAWRAAVRSADGLLICTPEYAAGVPGALKNALDWLVSSGELLHKPTAVVSASPTPLGGSRAHESLRLTLGMLDARLIGEAHELQVPFVSLKLDAAGRLADDGLAALLRSLLERLTAAAARRESSG
ncbi:NAD(P)H-dependent oxidoreductase [Paenibacillus athensensis]|uniref:NADPH-dependent FMN reductase-like domain-containing protein n=1 Tax=Paenibacillus athensensis TaxID=1967502 RepID=A0A4Y8PZ79_9BACL|nr:NADPH-dependent FMN reductase [Paenibacillus athensensis]MCD1259651.1 NAD(P)H-dependent oxidoreductase [Paenibacillus athensensis]